MSDEQDKVAAILGRHKDRRFVQRIEEIQAKGEASKDYPHIANEDGSISTHRMSTAEAGGKHYAYPRIMEDEDGNLRDYGRQSFREAMRRKEFVEFSTAQEADWFSRNYKRGW